MHNEFTAIIAREDEWFIAYCAEIPGANGQGRTSEEARANLGEAIALILEDRREDALRGVAESATRETVVVEQANINIRSSSESSSKPFSLLSRKRMCRQPEYVSC
jgi:predicted RNase H-like HicB family nuclease